MFSVSHVSSQLDQEDNFWLGVHTAFFVYIWRGFLWSDVRGLHVMLFIVFCTVEKLNT